MSGPDSPTERLYQFISDPGHKENLSGRVRAACLTCRRKKIKCSGEFNCSPCREKGLVCEGLPERKRPSRDSSSALAHGPVLSGRVERKKKSTSPNKPSPQQKLATALVSGDTVKSKDSGDASTQAETEATLSLSPAPLVDPVAEADTTNMHLRGPTAAHEAGLRIHTWHLNDTALDPNERDPLSATNTDFQAFNLSPCDALFSADAVRSPFSWTNVQDDGWWTSKPEEGVANLTASVPPDLSHPRPLALTPGARPSMNAPHDITRRQTIAFPLQPPSEPQYGLLQNQHGVFDDLALLTATRTPGTGTAPHLTEFSCWWDIANLDFAQAHRNLHMPLPEHQQAGALNSEIAPNNVASIPQQQLKQQQNAATDYFGPLWPDRGG